MTALPLSTTFTDNSVTEAGLKQSITNLRDYLSGLLGTTGVVADARTVLGAQTTNAKLDSFVALTGAPNKLPYFTGTTSMAVADITAQGLELLNDTSYSAMLTTLGAAPVASPTFTGVPAAPTAAAGTNTTQIATTAFVTANQYPSGRNRVTNGDCRIDQKRANVAFTVLNGADNLMSDGWYSNRNGPSGSGPYSYTCTFLKTGGPTSNPYRINWLQSTSSPPTNTTNQEWICSKIEGIFVEDFLLGTASAKAFTVSFSIRTSITGTYAATIQNSAATMSYVHTFSTTANTWTNINFTVPGPTSGTWLTTVGTVGLKFIIDVGSYSTMDITGGETVDTWVAQNRTKTSSCTKLVENYLSTLDITNLQIEVGSIVTPFEYLPFDTSIYRCKRYYETSYPYGTAPNTTTTTIYNRSTLVSIGSVNVTTTLFEVEKATTPTSYSIISPNSGSGGNYIYRLDGTPADLYVTTVVATPKSIGFSLSNASNLYVSYHWTAEVLL